MCFILSPWQPYCLRVSSIEYVRVSLWLDSHTTDSAGLCVLLDLNEILVTFDDSAKRAGYPTLELLQCRANLNCFVS